jgi:MOSC domain-containing protein YiiM/ferredoxin-NADP reductase
MSAQADIDLWAPCTSDTILEIRTSRMKKMPGLQIESGIDKLIRDGPIKMSFLGLTDDEHDPTFHGGVDKAVHGCMCSDQNDFCKELLRTGGIDCASHYPAWQSEFPTAAERFKPGGFGENLVFKHMNERNICIGDVYAVGDGVKLQVSLPRQPCFKLNHRFQLKNFAPNTYKSNRTGWYYRVLSEGTVKAGDEVNLIERKWPQWTIERLQEYLHKKQGDLAINEELSQIEAMGAECRDNFKNRVLKAKAKAETEKDKGKKWRNFKIVEKTMQTPRIASFILEADTKLSKIDKLSPGSHATLKLPNGLTRSYSIVSGDWNRIELGIALDQSSRGGSKYFHHTAMLDDKIEVSNMSSSVPKAAAASNHLFIAGGIGITAFLELMKIYHGIHFNFELHYAVRSEDEIPFRDRLEALGDHVHIYDQSKGERMNIIGILGSLPWNTQVYVCGPARMLTATKEAAAAAGLDEDEIHYEAFAADLSGDPFEAEIVNKESRTVKVAGDETLLEVLQREFGDIDSSCQVGNCGTCKVALKSGRVEHRGTALSKEEKNTSMLSCVSRGIGRVAIEI